MQISGTGVTMAKANSAQTFFMGVDATGAIMTDTQSPIIVEKELLTLNLSELPQNYHNSTEEFIAYDGKVTAQYTFYNPSEYTVTSKLLFPFGEPPSYGAYVYDDENGNHISDDTAKYDITIDGAAVEKKIRHSLSFDFEEFDVQRDLGRICDGFVEDDFYSPSLPVAKYTYYMDNVNTKQYDAAYVAFDLKKGGDAVILFKELNGGQILNNGDYRIGTWVKNRSYITLYAIGNPLSTLPKWKFYKNGGAYDGDEISGDMTLMGADKLTFKDLALLGWSETSAVSESDWYNAVVTLLSEKINDKEYNILDTRWLYRSFYESLMRWYEYEITLEPGQRIVNSVTAPMYPDIDLDWSPAIFNYTYYLSPAKTWKSFGELEIIINTPYYITESVIEGFEKTESGYKIKLNGLPESELEFTLCTAEEPTMIRSWYDNDGLLRFVIWSFIIAPIVFVIAGIVVAVVLVVRDRKRRSNE